MEYTKSDFINKFINPINANIALKWIFNGKLADMFSDGLANLDK